MASRLAKVTADGDVYAGECYLKSVVLTGGSDAATLDVKDGSTGAVVLTIKAAINTSVEWVKGDEGRGPLFVSTLYADFTGTGPSASFEFEPAD